MGSKAPPVPRDQQFHGRSSSATRDPEVSHDPAGGNAGINLKEQGRHGNMRQNISNHWRTQDR